LWWPEELGQSPIAFLIVAKNEMQNFRQAYLLHE
jgi:hypothetical protein